MKRGDWVVFEDHGKREIGRVWRVGTKNAAVCYHFGCTPASTPMSMLRPYDREKDSDLVPDARIGHYRFESYCPDYDDAVCWDCKPEMAKRCRRTDDARRSAQEARGRRPTMGRGTVTGKISDYYKKKGQATHGEGSKPKFSDSDVLTCKNVSKFKYVDGNNGLPQFKCSECGCEINDTGEDGAFNCRARIICFIPESSSSPAAISLDCVHYCPICGAKVVQDAD